VKKEKKKAEEEEGSKIGLTIVLGLKIVERIRWWQPTNLDGFGCIGSVELESNFSRVTMVTID